MRTTIVIGMFCMGILLMQAAPVAQAQFLKIDDFEDNILGDLIGQADGWVTGSATPTAVQVITDPDPAGGSNQVMEVPTSLGKSSMTAIDLGTGIPVGSVGTLFFRFRNTRFADVNTGLRDIDNPDGISGGSFRNLKATIRTNDTDSDTNDLVDAGHLDGSDGTNDVIALEDPFAPDTWYKMWIVADNSAKTNQFYIQGGAFPTQTALDDAGGNTLLGFRRGFNTPEALDLTAYGVRTNSAWPDDQSVYIDDIYLDLSGPNLTDPVGGGPVLKAGDVNGDMVVDLTTDFQTILDNFQDSMTTRAEGDLNFDGMVNFRDFREWKIAFEEEMGTGGASIPEPANFGLAIIGGTIVMLARRRRSRRLPGPSRYTGIASLEAVDAA